MPILSTFAQNPVKEAFMKISFFANDYVSFWVVSISQRSSNLKARPQQFLLVPSF